MDRRLVRNPLCLGRRTVRHWLLAGLLLALVYALPSTPAEASCKEPVYVIAHRCNDPEWGPNAVKNEGPNAIEVDLRWGNRDCVDATCEGNEWALAHDGVTSGSTYLADWLEAVRNELNREGSALSLIIIDLKTPDGPLMALYNAIRDPVTGLGPNINLIFSTADFDNRWHFNQIKDAINNDPRAGVAIDELAEDESDERQANVKQFFEEEIGITKYWFADGVTAAVVTPDSVYEYVDAGMALRDANTQCDAFHGVYTWTYETEGSFHEFLNKGVNGLMVNSDECFGYASPGTADDASEAVHYAKTGLPGRKFATPEDNPFEYLRPGITCPPDITLECVNGFPDPNGLVLNAFLNSAISPTEADLCYGDVHITSDNSAALLCPVNESREVLFVASAPHGHCDHVSSCEATVTVQDTIAPAAHCPANIAVDPVSPQGTVVSFSATATDSCDASPSVACPASGATFGVGTETVVTCTATDASDNQQPCSLTVKVYTLQEVVANLQNGVAALDPFLNHGQQNSLESHLKNILKSIDQGKKVPACQQLQSFINKVGQLISSGDLTLAQGQPLIQSATNLRNTLGC